MYTATDLYLNSIYSCKEYIIAAFMNVSLTRNIGEVSPWLTDSSGNHIMFFNFPDEFCPIKNMLI